MKRGCKPALAAATLTSVCALLLSFSAFAQSLYKYRGPNGEWIYADVPPADGEIEETRQLATGADQGGIEITAYDTGTGVGFRADNRFYAPVELQLKFTQLEGLVQAGADSDLTWVVPARGRLELIELKKQQGEVVPGVRYDASYMIGDPNVVHDAAFLYRVPFAIATNHPITQAYPDMSTHRTPDSSYAVDVAMPIGTNIFAARAGVVFDVSSDHFTGGTDPERDAETANVVQVLHDDGTFAVYAHLNWNSIRVRPGERVERGQYIADSGNTGFSSGPHLHFAVLRNTGLATVSVPVRFAGANNAVVVPVTGATLTAY